MLDLLIVEPKFTRPACHMTLPTTGIARRCTALLLLCALPLGQTDRRTDRRTRESRDTTVLTLNKLITPYVMKRYSTHRRSTSFRRCCRDSRPVCHRRMNTKCSRSWRTEISRFHTQLYTHTLAYTLLTVTTASLLQKLYCSDNNINTPD